MNRTLKTTSVTLFAAVLGSGVVLAKQRASDPAAARSQAAAVSIGIVRGDGVMLPVATLRNATWLPLSADDLDGMTLSREANALARTGWTVFPSNGSTASPMSILGTTVAEAHCMQIPGFRTNARRMPQPASWPRPKNGVAVHGPATVVRAADVRNQPDAPSRAAARVIVALVHSLEAERVDSNPNSLLQRFSTAERGRVPVHVTSMSRTQLFNDAYYYFEARKRYNNGADTFVRGWLHVAEHKLGLANVTAVITDLDYKGVSLSTLLGAFQLEDRAVWIFESHGYESESYELLESQPFQSGPRLVFEIPGGGC